MSTLAQSAARLDRQTARALTLFPDEHLLKRAVQQAHVGRGRAPRWLHVGDAFAVGADVAKALCRRFGLEPNELAGVNRL